MPIDAVVKLEAELDNFKPHEDLARLLLFRILAIEYPHRIGGGRTAEQAAADMKHYLAALELAESLSLDHIDLPTVQGLHATLAGRTGQTALRKQSVAVRPNIPDARGRLIGTPPADVLPRMEEVIRSIYRNPGLGRFERIALGYFEIIRTHPFEDGNGRLSRLLLTALVRREFHSHLLVNITRIMRSDFRLYHRTIRNQDEDVYVRWLSYISGAVTAELHAAERFGAALLNLDSDDRNATLRTIKQTIKAFREGGGSSSLLHSAAIASSAKSAQLVMVLMD